MYFRRRLAVAALVAGSFAIGTASQVEAQRCNNCVRGPIPWQRYQSVPMVRPPAQPRFVAPYPNSTPPIYGQGRNYLPRPQPPQFIFRSPDPRDVYAKEMAGRALQQAAREMQYGKWVNRAGKLVRPSPWGILLWPDVAY